MYVWTSVQLHLSSSYKMHFLPEEGSKVRLQDLSAPPFRPSPGLVLHCLFFVLITQSDLSPTTGFHSQHVLRATSLACMSGLPDVHNVRKKGSLRANSIEFCLGRSGMQNDDSQTRLGVWKMGQKSRKRKFVPSIMVKTVPSLEHRSSQTTIKKKQMGCLTFDGPLRRDTRRGGRGTRGRARGR